MAAGDLILGQGDGTLQGAASGVTIADPGASATTTLTSADNASLRSVVESTGARRLITASGLQFDMNAELASGGSGLQMYNPSGGTRIEGYGIGNTNLLNISQDDTFIGNILLQPSIGQAGLSNNLGTACQIISGTMATGIYLFYVGCETHADVSGMSGDEPENFSIFNNTGVNNTRLITLHGCYVPNEESGSKFMTFVAGTDGSGNTNTLITILRGYSFAASRSPFVKDGGQIDIVNFVQPAFSGFMQGGITSGDTQTNMNIRGCSIYGNSAQFDEVNDGGTGDVYYGTSGLTPTTDHSVELNSPTVNITAQTTSRLSGFAHEPTATAMDGTLRAAILAEDYTTYAITLESPPGTLDPITAGHAAVMSFDHAFYPTIQFTKMEPYEQRFRDSLFRPWFYRWNNAAKTLVKEWTADWPGLNPHAERGANLLPAFQGVY